MKERNKCLFYCITALFFSPGWTGLLMRQDFKNYMRQLNYTLIGEGIRPIPEKLDDVNCHEKT
jgi:hypothetical protein